ncbi:hypothetical protein ACIBQ0_09915 [Nocardia nova]|uniref:hypothetical protein n=1 Tax=Nocardia nova TaxID=37330 RepID=UPI0037A66E89
MIAAPPALRRAGLARLVVVLAALLGMLAIQNTHCTAGSAMGTSMTAAASIVSPGDCGAMHQAADSVANAHQHDAVAVADSGITARADHASPMLACDIAMACLAVFLALLTVLAVAPQLVGRVRADSQRAVRRQCPVPAVPRPPSLAELCILRT